MPIVLILIPLLSVFALLVILLYSKRFKKLDPKIHFLAPNNSWLQKISADLTPRIRLFVLVTCAYWGIAVAGFLYYFSFDTDEFLKGLIRTYGFTALFLLFLTLTPGMLRIYFPAFILDSLLIKARRALGVSTFTFAFLHGVIAFLYYYIPLQKISQASFAYQLALYFAIAALFILALMAITSFDKMVEVLSMKKWKLLHRFVYLTFLLSILHGFIRGTHLNEPYRAFAAFMIFLTLTFILLEIGATIGFTLTHPSKSPLKKYFIFITVLIVGISAFYLSLLKLDQLY